MTVFNFALTGLQDDESVQRANGQTSSSNREAVQLEACLQVCNPLSLHVITASSRQLQICYLTALGAAACSKWTAGGVQKGFMSLFEQVQSSSNLLCCRVFSTIFRV